MNYYEQFYDDLEFCDPADEEPPPKSRPPPPADARSQPYWDEEEEFMTHRDQSYTPRGRGRGNQANWRGSNMRGREDGGHQDRGRGGRGGWDRGRGGPDRGRGGPDRGRGVWDRGRGGPDRGRGGPDRGRGGWNRGRGDLERGRGRGGRGVQRGNKMGFVNFVKAEDKDPEAQPDVLSRLEQVVGNEIEAIRNDCQSQQEKSEVSAVFTSPVLSSYGYGDGSDFQQFGATPYATESSMPSALSDGPPGESQPPDPTPVVQPQPNIVRTSAHVKPATIPALNFVKAKSEFKSTDVAFHEAGKQVTEEDKVRKGFTTVGAKRAGLGMNLCSSGSEALSNFQARIKTDGSNPLFDARFAKLSECTKSCYDANKNGIEILHVAISKSKMKLHDDARALNRTNSGQVLFSHRLEVDGVFLGYGEAVNKKGAKHEAFTNAVKLLIGPRCTVKQVNGVLELKPVEEMLPADGNAGTSIGPSKVTPHAVSQGQPAVTNKAGSTLTAPTHVSYPTSHLNMSGYSKPKMVFHQASVPPVNSAQKSAAPVSNHPNQPLPSPSELADKLVNFVKEGDKPVYSKQPNSPQNPPQKIQMQQANRPFPNIPPQNPFLGMKRNLAPAVDNKRLPPKKVKPNNSLNNLTEFVIFDNSAISCNNTDIGILHVSSNYNNVIFKLEHGIDVTKPVDEGCTCNVIIGDHVVASGNGNSKDEAKRAAASKAISLLREICYTIVVKQNVDSNESGLTKEELLGSLQKGSDVIPDSNIGNMLLRKMGWAGGGVGKDGKGIAEPVKAEMIIRREGLGLSKEKGIAGDFRQKVHSMLVNHINSDNKNDLYFSPEMTKEERMVIHTVGQKLGLKTQSKGKGEERYLIVSRKRSVGQLLEHVIDSGGSTSKYEIIPPTNAGGGPGHRDALSYGHSKQ